MAFNPTKQTVDRIRERLLYWEEKTGRTATSAAEELRCSIDMYRSIRQGRARPSVGRLYEFQEATGVPGSFFYPEVNWKKIWDRWWPKRYELRALLRDHEALRNAVRSRLLDWETQSGYTTREAARACGYGYAMYAKIRQGVSRPSLDRLVDFQEVTGVPGVLFYPEIEGML